MIAVEMEIENEISNPMCSIDDSQGQNRQSTKVVIQFQAAPVMLPAKVHLCDKGPGASLRCQTVRGDQRRPHQQDC